MSSIAEIRHHIKAVQGTSKITRAMYLISSAKGRVVHEYEAVIYVPTVGIISWQDKGVPSAPQRGTWS